MTKHPRPPSRTLLADVGWGVRSATRFALLYGVLAAVLSALGGAGDLRALEIPLSQLVLLYVASGVVVGGIVGFARPWTRTSVGAAVVGVAAAWPVALSMSFIVSPQGEGISWRVVVVLTLIYGIGGSVVLRRLAVPTRRTPESEGR